MGSGEHDSQNMIICKLMVNKHGGRCGVYGWGGGDGRLAERGDVRLLLLLQQVIHLVWCRASPHLDLPAIHAQYPFHFSRVMTLAQKICTRVGALAVMPPYFLCSFVLVQCIIMAVTLNGCNYNTRATISSKKIEKCRWSTLHMTLLYRQLLNETGRHTLLYIICIFMQAQPWMSEGLNDGRGLPWCTTMNICTFIIGLVAEILWAASSVIQAGF